MQSPLTTLSTTTFADTLENYTKIRAVKRLKCDLFYHSMEAMHQQAPRYGDQFHCD